MENETKIMATFHSGAEINREPQQTDEPNAISETEINEKD